MIMKPKIPRKKGVSISDKICFVDIKLQIKTMTLSYVLPTTDETSINPKETQRTPQRTKKQPLI